MSYFIAVKPCFIVVWSKFRNLCKSSSTATQKKSQPKLAAMNLEILIPPLIFFNYLKEITILSISFEMPRMSAVFLLTIACVTI